ncbi:quinone oxidoreductase family protein [Sphingomonas sp. SRS2]|uniref:quinone oxidoreductase family protein n=1 Tax=Sphingomonas sp. SRS2 TaxID=133190 RepID=UPI0006184E29|nr:quinone oxidoreductase [Sphingomonas sp. SRS2]KKC26536.1 quinone oxidoreductase [Sphingomonas sp. SRS2]
MSEDYRLVARRFGGPEVIEAEPIVAGPVAPGQARVRHRAIGVNFIDTYHRSGLYPQKLPALLGVEGAGVVEALGDGVAGLTVGQRVVYAVAAPGSYASWTDVAADRLLPLPAGTGDELAAAATLKGLTAQTLIFGCARIAAGQTALVHAAAGGMGRLLVQWLAAIGVTVIAHAGSAEKAAIAAQLGAAHALHCPQEALATAVRDATGGRGVDVVFDGVGAASFTASLDSLTRRGLLISYGNSSGPVPPFSPLELASRGSLIVTRPRMYDFVVTRAELEAAAADLFTMIGSGKLAIEIALRLPLREAAEAHRALEGRRTTGSIVLSP